MKKYITLGFLLTFWFGLLSQTPHFDTTFGGTGIVYPTSDYWNSYAINNFWDMAISDEGKIIVVGQAQLGSAPFYTVMSYLENGFPDLSFGDSGIVFLPQGVFTKGLRSVVVQNPGSKIVIAGSEYFNSGSSTGWSPQVIRLNSDGSFDKTLLDYYPGNGNLGYCTALAIQTDGRILAAGYLADDGDNFAVFRINDDDTFELFKIPVSNIASVDAISVQSDGKIIVAGGNKIYRLTQNGNLDTSFGTAGHTDINQIAGSGADNSYSLSISILPDDKILLAGNSGAAPVKIGRLTKDGIIDVDFEIVNTKLDTFSINNIAVEENGNIIVVGRKNSDFALSRISFNGSFMQLVTDDDGEYNEIWTCVALQDNGKIITAGYSDVPYAKFALARYNTDLNVGSLESTSTINFLQCYPNPTSNETILNYSVIQPGGISIKLLDANGKQICTFIEKESRSYGEHTEHLNIPAYLPQGVYFLVLNMNGESFGHKIILERN